MHNHPGVFKLEIPANLRIALQSQEDTGGMTIPLDMFKQVLCGYQQ